MKALEEIESRWRMRRLTVADESRHWEQSRWFERDSHHPATLVSPPDRTINQEGVSWGFSMVTAISEDEKRLQGLPLFETHAHLNGSIPPM